VNPDDYLLCPVVSADRLVYRDTAVNRSDFNSD